MNLEYIAVIINSTIRSTTPVLFAALGSAICYRAGVFNIALEAQMLAASFTSIAVNFATGNLLFATLAGIGAGLLVSAVVAQFQVKFKAKDIVVGTSINLLVGGMTVLLLFTLFGVRGVLNDPALVKMPTIIIPGLSNIPVLGDVFGNLTIFDYLSYAAAFLLFVYLFKTISGFRLLSVGVNKEATLSLGIKAERTQVKAVLISGVLCGIGGCALAMGQVTLFVEGMTAGRGWIALAAAELGLGHPLYVIISSLFFGLAQSISVALQVSIPSHLTMAFPYIATIAALGVSGYKERKNKEKARQYGI